MTPTPGVFLTRTVDGRAWECFRSPVAVIEVTSLADVVPALAEIEEAVTCRGLTAAGFISYEAAPAFDAALVTRSPGNLPLLWFGLYEKGEILRELPGGAPAGGLSLVWEPEVDYARYRDAIRRIKAYIASGDTYQVNHTLRLNSAAPADPSALFAALWEAQPTPYATYLNTGTHALCSVSPELFFSLEGERILSRPMKGTAPRGRTREEDRQQVEMLRDSEKDRAENVMIVDMIRNDLGRIARSGSVRAPRLFAVERHDTLFQMTSDVTAETAAPFPTLMAALFPCASITGAPKVRTMQIIAELEASPRGAYTGALGWLRPGRQARFSVAIRTVQVDLAAARAGYGTGGGIVWDSTEAGEYEEARTKALVLLKPRPHFRLLETLLWAPDGGYRRRERHLARLFDSAAYFAIPLAPEAASEALAEAARSFPAAPQRVRLLVDERGVPAVEAAPFQPGPERVWRLARARAPVDPGDRFLYHKTTRRGVYEEARAGFPSYDDVLLWNPQGEVTESTIANVVVRLRGELVTPPVRCGLLPGVFRAELLDTGQVKEAVIRLEDLPEAEEIFLVNSLRGWRRAEVEEGGGRHDSQD